jgi:putative glycosyltransferase
MTPDQHVEPTLIPLDRPQSAAAAGLRPALSIVATMYRSRPFLEQFLAESLAALRGIGCDSFEIVLVNDGSPDDSLQYALQRRRDIAQLVVVDLSRNFGHHQAMHAGLRHARGELVFLIDCDLEVPPATLATFHARLRETGADMVYGYQESRKGGWFERLSGGLFWKGFNLLSDIRIPENVLTERIMTRRFVDALLSMGDYNLFLGGMMSWTGFTQLGMPVAKGQRAGSGTYTLLKRFQLMVNAVSSFSSKPLVWLFNAGLLITLASFSYAAYLVFRKLAFGDALLGFTSVMALTALSLGILTTSVGLVGIYLGKVFNQVQNRPTYIVRDVYRQDRR